MKRLMVILAIVCSTANIFASDLVIKGNVDVAFSVFINGEKYYSYYHEVTVKNLPKGTYDVEIYTEGANFELLYDFSVNIPKNTTVYATFDGDNTMYITNKKDVNNKIIINLTPYPKRASKPAPNVYHSYPKKAEPYHSAPAAKPAPKPAAKAEPAKSTATHTHTSSRDAEVKSNSAPKASTSTAKPATSTAKPAESKPKSTTSATSSSSTNSRSTTGPKSSTRSTPESRK